VLFNLAADIYLTINLRMVWCLMSLSALININYA